MKIMKQSTRTGWMVAQGIAMIVLGLGLFYLRATMTSWLFTVFGSVLSLLLIAASLLFIVVSDVICAAGLGAHRSPLFRRFLSLSAIAAGAGIVVILLPATTIRATCWLIAVYSLLLSIVKTYLATHWRGTPGVRPALYALAGLALVFCGLLVAAAIAAQGEQAPVVIIGAYSLYMGFQMLLTTYCVRRGVLTPPREQELV
ncbi:MAG: hypothetical protein WCC27_20085 [Acidobacteriaceae bacterium]